jgi:hypothetical protein
MPWLDRGYRLLTLWTKSAEYGWNAFLDKSEAAPER